MNLNWKSSARTIVTTIGCIVIVHRDYEATAVDFFVWSKEIFTLWSIPMSAPRTIGTAENPSRNLLVKEFLSCQHLLSDDEVLEFLSGGDFQSEDAVVSTDIDKRLMDTWRRHQHDSCDEHFHLRQAYVLHSLLTLPISFGRNIWQG